MIYIHWFWFKINIPILSHYITFQMFNIPMSYHSNVVWLWYVCYLCHHNSWGYDGYLGSYLTSSWTTNRSIKHHVFGGFISNHCAAKCYQVILATSSMSHATHSLLLVVSPSHVQRNKCDMAFNLMIRCSQSGVGVLFPKWSDCVHLCIC